MSTDLPADQQKRSGTIQSISIASRFLKILADADGPLPLIEIARRNGTSSPTAHRYLQSLIKEGLATQDPASARYDLGPAALHLGVGALKRIDAVEVGARHMQALALRIGVSGGVAIWTPRGPTIVRWFRGTHFSIGSIGLGDILPIDNTATGLVFQAYLPDAIVKATRERQPASFRGKRPGDAVLAAIRKHSGSELNEHIDRGVAAQAAPVFDAQKSLACVITTISNSAPADAATARDALIEAARSASRECGGS